MGRVSPSTDMHMAKEKANSIPELESAFSSHLPPRQRNLLSEHCGPLKTIVRQAEDPSGLNKSRLWVLPVFKYQACCGETGKPGWTRV